MKRIQIRAVGRLPEAWQREAQTALLARLQPYAKTEILEVSEGHGGSRKPDATRAKRAEAEALRRGTARRAPTNAFVIALDEHGKEYDSLAFAKQIETWSEGGRPLVFLIGGSWGLDEALAKDAHAKLSLGKMTWPHAIARLLLLEQLFRAETIARGKEYHKRLCDILFPSFILVSK
ncbi:MAG: 23S rRNA (pseudouridine(1915)-N(3))-methyltransferase RlmH [Patescibacteria group bacterium]